MKGLFAVSATITALLFAVPAIGQTVYKCKDKNGSPVFAQMPCASEPSKVETMTVKGIGKTDDAAAEAVRSAEADGHVARKIRDTEDACVRNRTDAVYRPSNARVRDYQGRIRGLENRIALANNNLAGATYESGLRSEIAALQSSISDERSSADRLASTARSDCADDRKRSEDREAERKQEAASSISPRESEPADPAESRPTDS